MIDDNTKDILEEIKEGAESLETQSSDIISNSKLDELITAIESI